MRFAKEFAASPANIESPTRHRAAQARCGAIEANRRWGFEVATDQPFSATQRWIELRIANSATRVVLFTSEGHENRIGTFFNGSLACDDVIATYRQFKQRGVEFVREPVKEAWGTSAIFKDPDGNQFVLSN